MARVSEIPTPEAARALEASIADTAREGLARGASHFDAGRFWDAHEEWEGLWQAEPRPIRSFYQGLILIAAGLHHWTRTHRPRGVQLKLAQGVERLDPYRPRYLGVDVQAMVELAERLRAEAEGRGADWLASRPAEDFPSFLWACASAEEGTATGRI